MKTSSVNFGRLADLYQPTSCCSHENGICLYCLLITNVSKDKQCRLNQTALDLGIHLSASTLFNKVGLLAFKIFQ